MSGYAKVYVCVEESLTPVMEHYNLKKPLYMYIY